MKVNYKIIHKGSVQIERQPSIALQNRIADQEKEIERIWQKRQVVQPNLFDGKVFVFLGEEESESELKVFGDFVRYRDFIAHLESDIVNVQPIGVSGMIIFEDQGKTYTIFSQRSANVTEYPSCFELMPSGTMGEECQNQNRMNTVGCITTEFFEETGLPLETNLDVEILGLVYDTAHQVFDVCHSLKLNITKEKILDQLKLSSEHDQFMCVAIHELDSFLQEYDDQLVPTTKALLDLFQQRMSIWIEN